MKSIECTEALTINHFLRVTKNGAVETSQGVTIDSRECERLIRLLETNKAIGEKVNEKFPIVRWNGVLKVGCHTIDKEEVIDAIQDLKAA